MTNEEAILDIRENIQPIIGGKSLDIAISAIERQIPKKPICKKYTDDTRCPTCNTFVLIHNKYCIECGQALDWSDTE